MPLKEVTAETGSPVIERGPNASETVTLASPVTITDVTSWGMGVAVRKRQVTSHQPNTETGYEHLAEGSPHEASERGLVQHVHPDVIRG